VQWWRSPIQTDNSNLFAKLTLRRRVIATELPGVPLRVIDCCQGSGLLWSRLREEFPIETYWGIDRKAKPGRMTIDSVRVLSGPLTANVIDIDTYGSPWDHWVALLPNVTARMVVFLTIGYFGGLGRLGKTALQPLGLASIHVPMVMQRRLLDRSIGACLALPLKRGLSVTVWTTKPSTKARNAQYFAALVEPRA
jgi:hypothetical protein